MALFKIPVKDPILQISEYLFIYLFIYLFLLLLLLFQFAAHQEDYTATKMCCENSFKKTVCLQIMILPILLPKYTFQDTTKRCHGHIRYRQAT